MIRCSLIVTPPRPDAPLPCDPDWLPAISGLHASKNGSGSSSGGGLPIAEVVIVDTAAGFARACNEGAARATQPYVLFLAPDVWPRGDWMSPLLRCLADHPRAAAAGGKLLSAGETTYHAGIAIDGDGLPRRLYAGLPADHAAVNVTRPMRMVCGASLLVRRSAFDEVGGFDAAFAAEEAAFDLCLRLGEHGHEVYYCHESVAACPVTGAAYGDTLAQAIRSRRLFRTRWIHKLQPDDVRYYAADRLLQVRYDHMSGLPRVIVSPPLLSSAPEPGPGREPGRHASVETHLLTSRAHQVHALLEANAHLQSRVASLEMAGRGALGAQSAAASATTVATDDHSAHARSAQSDHTDQSDQSHQSDQSDRADALEPSAELSLSVGGEFRATGEEFLTYFTEIGGLRPSDHVLDVGCGVGRMAVPLTRYLSSEGRYEGFDVMANAIEWCQRHITPRFPSFRFTHAALRNRAYNTTATQASTTYEFPYAAESFDFVFLTSVFTHLLPDEVRHYLAQIAMVLKPGGRCFVTSFLLNAESEGLIRAGLSPHFPFAHRRDGYRLQQEDVPEAAVAYDEALLRRWFGEVGLAVAAPIRYGFWCGRLDGLSLQDIILALKS